MKMHSYMSVNGYLQHVTEQSQTLLDDLREATERVGGWDKAHSDAQARRDELAGTSSSEMGSSPVSTPPILPGDQAFYVDADSASQLRKRLLAANLKSDVAALSEASAEKELTTEEKDAFAPHPLIDHPDAHISEYSFAISEM